MAQPGGSSFLANMTQRRRQLNRTREALFDRPGIQRQGGPPPARVPAVRPNPQQQSLDVAVEDQAAVIRATQPEIPGESPAEEPQTGPAGGSAIPPEMREEMLAKIDDFLTEQALQRRAALHRKIGKARRFFGGGV